MDGKLKPCIICFYHEYETHGYFSNWYRAEFEYVGKRFTSVEQYMMYQKVIMFRQYELAMKILASDNPAVVKKLGRTRFAGFDSQVWDSTSYAIVKRGVKAKFLQNSKLLRLLLDTGDCVLAECSLNDCKWGIGVDINNPDCMDPSKWTGKNYLGRILMEVRSELRTAALYGSCEYKDARDVDFAAWHEKAGVLVQNPKYHQTIKAYADTLHGDYERKCFYYDGPLTGWEEAMNTNMGGGLPAVGFWELKQDLYDIWRMTPGGII